MKHHKAPSFAAALIEARAAENPPVRRAGRGRMAGRSDREKARHELRQR
jgi:hypothetical protein